MIVVTGSIRTGTSLMMQTLRHLGVPIMGMAFHPVQFKHRDLNPKGYWDMPEESTVGGSHWYPGHAVKLYPSSLELTNRKYIRKIIVMRRGVKAVVDSSKELLERDGWRFDLKSDHAELIYDDNYKLLHDLLLEQDYYQDDDWLSIRFEDMIRDPSETVAYVADFLEIDVDLAAAIKNIDCPTSGGRLA